MTGAHVDEAVPEDGPDRSGRWMVGRHKRELSGVETLRTFFDNQERQPPKRIRGRW